MEKQVVLSIRGQQTFEEEEPEVVELVTEGKLSRTEDGTYTLTYQESELTGLEGTQTTFHIQDGCVTLLREGQVNSHMVFQEGHRYQTMHDTPYGSLTICICAHRVKVRIDEDGGELEIKYAIELNHSLAGEHSLQIQIRQRPDSNPPLS